MLQLTLRVQRIGIHHDHARPQGTQTHHQVLNEIGHLNRDAITAIEAHSILQPARKLRGQPIEIGIGQCMTHAAAGRLFAVGGQGLLEERHNRGVVIGTDLGRDTQCAELRCDHALDRFRHGVFSGNTDGLGMMWIAGCGVNLPHP